MSQKETDGEGRQDVHRRHSAGGPAEQPRARRSSATRRLSFTQGVRDSGRMVKETVEALFKDNRLDPEDDPEGVNIRPAWEEDLQKYLPPSFVRETPQEFQASSSSSTYIASNNAAAISVDNPSYSSPAELNAFFPPSKNPPKTLAAHRWHKAYEWVKKHNALKKKALNTPIGTGAKLDGRSLGVIPMDDETRKAVFEVLYQSRTEYILDGLIAGHLVVLVLKAQSKFITHYIPPKAGLDAADIIFTTFYTVEMLSRIFCLGFCRGPHTYLRNPFNKLDLVIVVDSWVHIARTVVLKRDAFLRIAILRVFRILLSFRHLDFAENVIAIMDAIFKSIYSLQTVFILTIMLLSFYAMVGVHFFGGKLQYRCVRSTDNQPSNPELFCVADPPPGYNGYGILCPEAQDQYCVPYENPTWGVSNWDNYGAAMLLLFQMLTFEGWGRQMFNVNETSGDANVFFCIFIVIGGYFTVNIYTAAVSSVFLRVRHEHQILLKKHRRDKEFTFANAIHMANLLRDSILRDDNEALLSWMERFKLRTRRRITSFRNTLSRHGTRIRRTMTKAIDWNDPNSYLKRISTFGMSGVDEALESGQSSRTFSRSFTRNLTFGAQQVARVSRNVSVKTVMAAQTVSQKCALIVNSKIFMYAVLTIISLNMAGLCTIRAKMSKQHRKRLEILEIAVLIVFSAEMAIRFVAAGLVEFVDEGMNLVDVSIIIISFCFVGFGPNKKFPNLTPIRMMRWFYVKKTKNEDVEKMSMVVTVMRSVGAVWSVFFFLVMVIFVFSIMSMELWGGQLSNFDDGYPRANHDTIFQAMLLWFSVTTAENWPNNMWNTMRPGVPYRYMGPILFVTFYLITAVVIINLIMAVILEQMELTDNQKKTIQKKIHIKWLQTKHHDGKSSEWLVKSVQGAQKRYKSIKKRMSTMKVSRMSLFPVFQPETGFVRMMPAPQVESAQDRDILPKRILGAGLSPSETTGAPFMRRSDTALNIPGAVVTTDSQGVERTKARIFRRSSLDALSSAGLLPQRLSQTQAWRRPSQDADKILLRSGFGDVKPDTISSENQTALQTALLNVMQDQREVDAAVKEKHKSAAKTAGAPMPDNLLPAPTVKPTLDKSDSFAMSDYEGIQATGEIPWWLSERSLFFFAPDNKIRRFCIRFVENRWNLYWQYLTIAISCFVVAETNKLGFCTIIQSPELSYSKQQYCRGLDFIVLITFSFDFLTKIVAYGFLFTPTAYLADPFNFIDLFCLMVHILKVTRDAYSDYRWFATFQLIASTRPIRFIVRARGLRSLTGPILRTLPAIGQVFIFAIIVYAIFAVIGMQLYANRFRHCTDPSVMGHADCVGHFTNSIGIIAPRTWVNPPFHFDSFADAMLALFVGSTFDNWLDNFAYPSMDLAHKQELQPRRNISPSHAIFFVSFMCIGGFYILRMFIGVFIDQFGIISGSKLLTERQKLFRDTNRIIRSLKPTRLPKHYRGVFRGACSRIVHSRKFEILVVVVVLINFGYIAGQYTGQKAPPEVFDKVEIMFVTLYIIEALLKLIGTQFVDWWHHKWNVGELVMVLLSAACLWPEPAEDSKRRMIGGFMYTLRIFRIARYIHQLNHMVSTIFISLPGMIDIASYMGIVIFFFSGLGTYLFQDVQDGSCYNQYDLSFTTFTKAFVTLLQVTTLDNWSCLLTDLTVAQPSCVASSEYCGLPLGGIIYMLLIVCITSFLFANIFVAQIIDTITFGLLDENAMLTPTHLFNYQKLWAQREFDYHCTGYIGHHKLREFLTQLGPPLGRRLTFRDKWMTRIEFEAFHFRSPKGIPFKSLLETLVIYKIGPRGLELPVRIERERQIKGVYQNGAAMKIQALARGYLQRKRARLRSTGDSENERPHE